MWSDCSQTKDLLHGRHLAIACAALLPGALIRRYGQTHLHLDEQQTGDNRTGLDRKAQFDSIQLHLRPDRLHAVRDLLHGRHLAIACAALLPGALIRRYGQTHLHLDEQQTGDNRTGLDRKAHGSKRSLEHLEVSGSMILQESRQNIQMGRGDDAGGNQTHSL
ncbi:hypothetical protein CRUP_003881 [Coryphaenoides rupestris]|nr:hypothetical protein CRUP_003881 [Coryphaenoides rupestris]